MLFSHLFVTCRIFVYGFTIVFNFYEPFLYYFCTSLVIILNLPFAILVHLLYEFCTFVPFLNLYCRFWNPFTFLYLSCIVLEPSFTLFIIFGPFLYYFLNLFVPFLYLTKLLLCHTYAIPVLFLNTFIHYFCNSLVLFFNLICTCFVPSLYLLCNIQKSPLASFFLTFYTLINSWIYLDVKDL